MFASPDAGFAEGEHMNQAGFGRAPAAATAVAASQKKRNVGWHVFFIGTGLTIAAYLTDALNLELACGAIVAIIVLAIIASIVFPAGATSTTAGATPNTFGESRTEISLTTLLCVFGILATIVIACKILGLFGDGLHHFIRSITP